MVEQRVSTAQQGGFEGSGMVEGRGERAPGLLIDLDDDDEEEDEDEEGEGGHDDGESQSGAVQSEMARQTADLIAEVRVRVRVKR